MKAPRPIEIAWAAEIALDLQSHAEHLRSLLDTVRHMETIARRSSDPSHGAILQTVAGIALASSYLDQASWDLEAVK